jgi:hypothetical protein
VTLDPGIDPVQPADAAPSVAPPPPPKPSRSGGHAGAGTLILAVGLFVAVGGVAFAVGRVTAPATSAAVGGRTFGNGANGGQVFTGDIALPNGSFAPGASFVPGADGFRAFGGALGGLSGTVTALTADTLTLQVGGASGRTIEIPLSSSTTYHTERPATAADVTVGAEVTVRTERGAVAPGQGGQGGQPGEVPQASRAPGAGGPPELTVGTATDVTVIPPSGQ